MPKVEEMRPCGRFSRPTLSPLFWYFITKIKKSLFFMIRRDEYTVIDPVQNEIKMKPSSFEYIRRVQYRFRYP